MELSRQKCPYCSSRELSVLQSDSGQYFLSCIQCGARGPAANDASAATLQIPSSSENLLRTVIDEAPDIIILKDWEGRFLLCNQALARLYNSTPEQMVGKTDADYNPDAEQVRFYQENIQAVMQSGQAQVVEEASTNAQTGEVRYFQSIKKPLKGPDGSDRILVIAHDVTELKRAYQVIEEKEKRYAYAMEAAGEGIWDWDISNNLVRHNPKWCSMLGLDGRLAEHDMAILETLIHPDDRDDMMAAVDAALAGGGEYSHEHRMICADGREIWVYDRGRVVEYSEEGMPLRMVGSISDVSARKEAERRLAETNRIIEANNEMLEQQVAERTAELASLNRELALQARRDALTGVGNRFLLQDWLSEKALDSATAVIMLDVDHFKHVNDQYGHSSGDLVLKAVASCLVSHVRHDDLVARIGGEEFILVLGGISQEQAYAVAEALRQKISELTVLPDGHGVTASFGVAMLACRSFDQTWLEADAALYRAKREGRNRVVTSP
ncbi:sensor domain-containing diguanylate cyclase [Marinobacterium sediminicola]|uniref:PAS domain S-box-containing protein/diguanylate cyclase (GGDEF) domain-containing protein n=1 Tax=Marinobacterium sediminicola TaxID=518898 RepID=A0ABY1S307_9GAMM|nr:sensor domain-containing diguanylate cyclase [Marinobacterium sediminicola]ULG70723.1 diguanylate cyclase [Marinobacterium sediminicola]SMR77318.1 PAS domain S-box-containing protein/diguanylate cyclase (GGDEF) domain-containing protein [Marinobacterium sediminicola]